MQLVLCQVVDSVARAATTANARPHREISDSSGATNSAGLPGLCGPGLPLQQADQSSMALHRVVPVQFHEPVASIAPRWPSPGQNLLCVGESMEAIVSFKHASGRTQCGCQRPGLPLSRSECSRSKRRAVGICSRESKLVHFRPVVLCVLFVRPHERTPRRSMDGRRPELRAQSPISEGTH